MQFLIKSGTLKFASNVSLRVFPHKDNRIKVSPIFFVLPSTDSLNPFSLDEHNSLNAMLIDSPLIFAASLNYRIGKVENHSI